MSETGLQTLLLPGPVALGSPWEAPQRALAAPFLLAEAQQSWAQPKALCRLLISWAEEAAALELQARRRQYQLSGGS